jgi:predicted ATPase
VGRHEHSRAHVLDRGARGVVRSKSTEAVITNLTILTGAPGSGKTAILNALRDQFRCYDEPARPILAEQRASGGDGTPEQNASKFVDLILQRSIANHAEAQTHDGTTLFDRGVPDCIAYAQILGVDPMPSAQAAAVHRYNPVALVTKPWEEIYTTDDERKMTFAHTVEFQRFIELAYQICGYTLVEVPRGSIEQRAAFVLASLANPPSSAPLKT